MAKKNQNHLRADKPPRSSAQPLPIKVFFNGTSFKPVEKIYSETLGRLLAEHFCHATELTLNSKRWFMFNVWNEVRSVGEGMYQVDADIIGPDSVAYDAQATWQEKDGQPVAAIFSKLPVRSLVKYYSDAPAKEVPLPKLPFLVGWIQWWESLLPDFFLKVQFASPVTNNEVDQLEQAVEALNPAYHKLAKRSRTIEIRIDFGSGSPITKNIEALFGELTKLHESSKIKQVIVGIATG